MPCPAAEEPQKGSGAVSTQALTKVEDLNLEPVERIEDLREQIQKLQGRANLVCPVVSVDGILAMHRLSLRVVKIDPTVDAKGNGREVYKGKFCEGDERALGKVALDKIDAAAGIQLLGRRRLDDRSHAYYCEIEVTKGLRDYDGTWRQTTKTKVVDLRDGSASATSLKEHAAVLAQARAVIQELAETKAGLRATRTLLSLRQKYTVAELSRPFVVPKLVPNLDPSDPDQKQALIGMATGREHALFGPQPGEEVREIRDVTPPPALHPPPVDRRDTHAPPTEPGPGGAVEEDDDFEMADFGAKDEPGIIVCLCPCGDQRQVTEAVAQATTEKVGAVRCSECFPGKGFDYQRHKDLPSLKLPKFPDVTADDVKAKASKK
jgi:hypothetical protein